MRIGGKTAAAILLRDDHGEEFLRHEEGPHFRRKIVQFPVDLPVVDHTAQFFDRTCQEILLFLGELCRRKSQKLLPVRIAGEKLRVPPHVAGLDSLTFGIGQLRQRVLRQTEDRLGDPVPPE